MHTGKLLKSQKYFAQRNLVLWLNDGIIYANYVSVALILHAEVSSCDEDPESLRETRSLDC